MNSTGDVRRLQELILGLQEEDIEKYDNIIQLNEECGPKLSQQIYEKQRQTIRENFNNCTEENSDKHFAQYHKRKFKYKGGDSSILVNFALLCLSHVTDPQGEIRQALTRQNISDVMQAKDIFQWQTSTRLTHSEYDSSDMKTLEYRLLKSWLKKKFPKPTLEIRPLDPCFRDDNAQTSVTVRLLTKYTQDAAAPDATESEKSTLMYIMPTDDLVVNYQAFIYKVLPAILEEKVTATSELACILDVSCDQGLQTISEILPVVPAHVSIKVLSAFDPHLHPVTCVILQGFFKGKVDNYRMKLLVGHS